MEKIEKKTFKLKKEYKKSEVFKSYYVTGALGGFQNQYDFRLAFYKDEVTDVLFKREDIINNEDLNENEKNIIISKMRVPCTLECEIVMPERSVVELYNFIQKELKNIKARRAKEKLIES